ncbi:MAG: L-serine ammonia-lyase, iron-sulfur-dependent subunit beta, partial [Anaerolineae bacterium]|nr:L-serine ammonia-lyase, iron-sulfur-dependent subunit beta [Anaerolineae bacterium]
MSAFDIIGPIMVGPSSSHTAGAVRLGQVARAILGSQPTEVLIELHGSFAHTGKGHGTDRGIMAGLLGMPADDPNLRDSFELAEQAGMTFRFETVDLGEDVHPNTARLTLTDGQRRVQVTGSSVGGGMVKIDS